MQQEDYPALVQDADAASINGHAWYVRITRLDLIAIVLGAAFGALAPALSDVGTRTSASLAAFFLLVGIIAKFIARTRGDDREWFNGRAVAETVKSLAFQYMMRVEPFHDDGLSDGQFARQLNEARNAAAALRSPSMGGVARRQQITPLMRDIRTRPLDDRKQFYIEHRLDDQIDWYQRKALFNQNRSETWYWISMATQLGAMLSAIMLATGVFEDLNLIGLFASSASAATAWVQLGNHDELAQSYRLAAHELIMLRDLVEQANTESLFGEAVMNGEAAISREHKMWIAKRNSLSDSLLVQQ